MRPLKLTLRFLNTELKKGMHLIQCQCYLKILINSIKINLADLCWERLKAGRVREIRRWDGWMASPTRWTWVWAAPGVGDRQGSWLCCSPWDHKESEWLSDWTELNWSYARKQCDFHAFWTGNRISPRNPCVFFFLTHLKTSPWLIHEGSDIRLSA